MKNELLNIAKKHSRAVKMRGDLERQNNDSDDFLDISVWSLQSMLEEAYELGKNSNFKLPMSRLCYSLRSMRK